MLREVAVSMAECRGRWILWLMHWLGKHGFRDCARNDEVWGLRLPLEWRGVVNGLNIKKMRMN